MGLINGFVYLSALTMEGTHGTKSIVLLFQKETGTREKIWDGYAIKMSMTCYVLD